MAFLTHCSAVLKGPFSSFGLGSIRTATKRAGGTVNNHGGSPGQRLGVKKFSDEFVIPGNIIVRQRGTLFHPGQHVGIGRDHTIFATAPGYVRFYKKKWMRGERRFVGLVLEKGDVLPRDEASRGTSRHCPFVNLNEFSKKHATVTSS
ncbi:ribosomal protein L27 [Coprinopsis marcescibilis]|uniref:Large ribosomal subunit protein bL27m n=1 Tax=Coprinopsis marcescibilis TaxID=230819 RepID=A0A5C3LB34_COPMA|nr:ribosomal protein L27 [Coprinopsis marcescibilis]